MTAALLSLFCCALAAMSALAQDFEGPGEAPAVADRSKDGMGPPPGAGWRLKEGWVKESRQEYDASTSLNATRPGADEAVTATTHVTEHRRVEHQHWEREIITGSGGDRAGAAAAGPSRADDAPSSVPGGVGYEGAGVRSVSFGERKDPVVLPPPGVLPGSSGAPSGLR